MTDILTQYRQVTIDGKIGFPDVMEYIIAEQEGQTTISPVPPELINDTSCHYTTRILDMEAFRLIDQTGFWYSPEHTGADGKVVDQRKAPG